MVTLENILSGSSHVPSACFWLNRLEEVKPQEQLAHGWTLGPVSSELRRLLPGDRLSFETPLWPAGTQPYPQYQPQDLLDPSSCSFL